MSLFRKLMVAGVASAVLAVTVAGAGPASAHEGDEWHHSECWIEATSSIDPACYNMVIWGGVARGWIPRTPFLFGYSPYDPFFLYYNPLNFSSQSNFLYYDYLGYPIYGPSIQQYNFGFPLYNQGFFYNPLLP